MAAPVSLDTIDQKIAGHIQENLEQLLEAQILTNARLDAVISALGATVDALKAVRAELARERTHTIVRDAEGNIVRTVVT